MTDTNTVTTPSGCLLLIDSRVADYQDIINATQPGVQHLVFNVEDTSSASNPFDYIQTRIAELGVSAYTSVGLVQHNMRMPLYSMFGQGAYDTTTQIPAAPDAIIAGVETDDPTLQTWAGVSGFISGLKTTYGIQNFDMMACALYSDPNWKYIIDTLTTQTGVTIRASTDDTGAAGLGGDWFLESHTGVNLKDVYFTEAIENYRGVLYVLELTYFKKSVPKCISIGSLHVFGELDSAGVTPTGATNNTGADLTSNIVAVCATNYAFSSLKSNGSVVSWGSSNYGANNSSVSSSLNSGVVALYSTSTAFAALKSDGSVVCWGPSGTGGSNNTSVDLSGNVIDIYSSVSSFIAIKTNGVLVSWGQSVSIPSAASSNIVKIYTSPTAPFAALKTDGTLINLSSGVSISSVASVLINNYGTVVLLNNGNMVLWGTTSYGTNYIISTDIIKICSTSLAFAGLNKNGTIVQWGELNYGGSGRPTGNGWVSLYSNKYAFIALNNNGTAESWGQAASGGGIFSTLTSIYDIYPWENVDTAHGFIALRYGGTAIGIGSSIGAGNSTTPVSYTNEDVILGIRGDRIAITKGNKLLDLTGYANQTAGNKNQLYRNITSTFSTGSRGYAVHKRNITEIVANFSSYQTNTSFDGGMVSMSSDGTVLAVSIPELDTNYSLNDNVGAIQVYSLSGTSWVRKGQDIVGTTSERISNILSLSGNGNVLAVGIKNANSNTGIVKTYDWSGSSWVIRSPNLTGNTTSDFFGKTISLSYDGSILAVGSDQINGTTTNAGQVQIYIWNNGWTQRGDSINRYISTNYFGTVVSLSADGNIVAILTPGNGFVSVFRYRANKTSAITTVSDISFGPIGWDRLGGEIYTPDGASNSYYSISLSADGTTIAIAESSYYLNLTSGLTSGSGRVRIYKYNASKTQNVTDPTSTSFGPAGWDRQGDDIKGENTNNYLGLMVSISSDGNIVAISKKKSTSSTVLSSDSVRIFRYNASKTTEQTNKYLINYGPKGWDLIGEEINCNYMSGMNLSSNGTTLTICCPESLSIYNVNDWSNGIDLSFSYYRDIDRYNILRDKMYRRQFMLTWNNNNIYTLSNTYDLQYFNTYIPTTQALRILVPTYTNNCNPYVFRIPNGTARLADVISPGENTYNIYIVNITAVTGGLVYGSDIYSVYSNISTSAIHAGFATAGQTLDVYLKIMPQASYSGTTRNGITSSSTSSYMCMQFISPLSPELNSVTIPSTTSVSYIIACDISERITIDRSIYTNCDGFVYKYETDGTFTKTTSIDMDGTRYFTYGGDGVYSSGIALVYASTTTLSNFNVGSKTTQDASFNLIDPSSNRPGSFTFTSSNTSVATISGRIVTITGSGTTTITATQDASGDYATKSITSSLVVASPILSNFVVPYKIYGDASFNLTDPSSNSTGTNGTFTFTSGNTQVATISNRTVTIIGPGTSIITASKGGTDISASLVVGFGNLSSLNSKFINDGPFVIPTPTSNVSTTYGTRWNQLGSDIVGKVAGDESGTSLSVSADGTIVAIGSRSNTSNRGTVRVYKYNDISWNQLGSDINGEASSDYSGQSVSLSANGRVVAIGANMNDGSGNLLPDSGHVRIYEFNGTSWVQRGGDIDGEANADQSGTSVSLSQDGNVVAIGAIMNDGSGNALSNSGHVRVYKYNSSKTSPQLTNQNLSTFGPAGWDRLGADIDGEAVNDQSGFSVSLSVDGTIVAIGAIFNDGTSGTVDTSNNRGHVRVYKYNSSKTDPQLTNQGLTTFGPAGWDRMGSDIDGEVAADQSGFSVSLSADGSTVAIGSPLYDASGSNSGRVRVFAWNGTSWGQRGGNINGVALNENVGDSVSLSADGSIISISSFMKVVNYNYNSSTNTWSQIGANVTGSSSAIYNIVNALAYGPHVYLDATSPSSYNGTTWTNIGSLGGNVVMTNMGTFDAIDNGGSFNFNGSSNFGRLDISSSTLTSLTYVAVVKTNLISSGQTIIDFGNDNLLLFVNGSGDLIFYTPTITLGFRLTTGVWYVFALTITTGGAIRFYVNGVSVFSGTVATINTTNTVWGIGAGIVGTTPNERWNGKISALAIYHNKVLTATEIANLSNIFQTYKVNLSSQGNIVAIGAREYDGVTGTSTNIGTTRVYKIDSSGNYTYTIGNSAIADICGNIVLPKTGGSTTLTVTQSASGANESKSATVPLTFSQITPTIGSLTVPAKNFRDASFNLTAPTGDSNGAFTYTSSNTAVATVTSDGGVVTIVGAGSATITATQAATTNYTTGSVSASLVVSPIAPTFGTFTVDGKNFRDASFSLTPPTTDSSGAFTYSGNAPTVATVTSDGVVTIVGAGSATITATQDACGNFTTRDVSASLVVSPIAPTIGALTVPAKNFGDASFNLTAPTTDSSGAFIYTSSDPTVATVTSSGGTVTILKVGNTTMTATQDACGNFISGSVSASLVVSASLSNFTVPAKNYTDAAFDLTDPTSTDTTVGFTFASSNTAVATIGGAGGRTVSIVGVGSSVITATQAATANRGELNITATLVVSPVRPVITLANITKAYGNSSFRLAPSSTNTDTSGGNVFSFSSNNIAVVSFLDASLVRINGVGTATIAITQAASANFTDSSGSVVITVNKGASGFSASTFTVAANKTYGDASFAIATAPSSYSIGTISYSSSDESVATIDNSGVITLVGFGTVNFTASQAESALYNLDTKVSNNLSVARKTVALTRVSPSGSTITKYYGNANFTVSASNESSGAFSYESSDLSFATVNASTGLVQIVAVGTTTITASRAQTAQYTSTPVSWTLQIERGTTTLSGLSSITRNVTVAPFTVSASSASNGAVSYALQDPTSTVLTIHPTSGLVTLLSPGSAVIVASQAQGTLYEAPSSITATIEVTAAANTLQGATLTNSTSFANVNLNGASLANTNITNTNFTSANLENTNFNSSDISGANMTSAGLSSASLTNTNITNTNFSSARLGNANFNNSTIIGSNMTSADLSGATMTGATITGTNFTSAILQRVDLSGASARRCIFNNADLSGCNLQRIDASGSSFVNSNFRGANLSNANFTNSDQTNANINGANISNVSYTIPQKLQLLRHLENRPIPELQVSQTTGNNILSVVSNDSSLKDVPNITNATFKVTTPVTTNVSGMNIIDIVLDTSNNTYFYFPINDTEYFRIKGVIYRIDNTTSPHTVRNYETNAVVENSTYDTKAIRLIAGSLTIIVNSQNTLPESSFVVPSTKINTDAPFGVITAPTSNSSAPIVYASTDTNIATIHPSTGVITLTGISGFVRFTASQVATETHQSASITSNEMFVNRLIDLTLPGLNQTFSLSTLASLDASSIAVETTDATAVFYVRLSDMKELFQYQTDSFDINDISSSDIKYYVFHRKWPAELKINPSHAMMNKTESAGMLGGGDGLYAADKSLVKHDFVRYIALRLFYTIYGVDLFNNETDLLENISYLGDTVQNNINGILSGISTTSSSATMSYDASGNKYLTNDTSGNMNLCRELMRQIAASDPSRLYNNGADNAGLKNVPLRENDSILFKLTITSATGQNTLTGVPIIPSRTYTIKLVLKNTVNSVTNANTVVTDSEMYSNSYAYSTAVTTYPPTSDSSGVYNVYSPPAPIPFSRFGYNGWYYTNSTTWVNVEQGVRDRVKWVVPANTVGSSTVGELRYIRVNMKVFNKTSLPYLVVYTQAGSYRKYTFATPNSLVNGTVYSFYMNLNSYSREPAMIGSTNAALTYSGVGSGSFANNEVITSMAVESDNSAAAGSVEFTLSSVVVGEFVSTTSVATEKEYGFSADVPVSYP